MNRKQRRASAKRPQPSSPARPTAVIPPQPIPPAPTQPPGLILRLFGRVVLSPWALRRVRHPEVERILISVAVQVGRPEIAESLTNRQAMRTRRGV